MSTKKSITLKKFFITNSKIEENGLFAAANLICPDSFLTPSQKRDFQPNFIYKENVYFM